MKRAWYILAAFAVCTPTERSENPIRGCFFYKRKVIEGKRTVGNEKRH
ncbi:hypothetical protein [Brevibacillus agri]|nr:hypothetical protein [Brevibacillus agri]MCG5249897.1 hypothetical protein [Brevibacillus agri]